MGLASLPQGGQQFRPQGSTGQHTKGRIDGLGRQLLAHVARRQTAETVRNLLGQAAPDQLCGDVLPQPRVKEFPDTAWVIGSDRVPGHLTTQGTGGLAQDSGHRTERMAVGQTQAHGLTFFRGQVSI